MGPMDRRCEQCGDKFSSYPDRKGRAGKYPKYCSRKCYLAAAAAAKDDRRRAASIEQQARHGDERTAKLASMLHLAAETLRTLAAAVEHRGGYAKGSPLDRAVRQAAAIVNEIGG